MAERIEELRHLGEMRDRGDLTEVEYQRLKAELLLEGPSEAPAAADTTPQVENKTRWWLIGTGVLMAIGSVLPWVQLGIFSAAGTEGDGVFTLIAGVIVALVGVANRVSIAAGILVAIVAAFSVWIVATVFGNLYDPLAIDGGAVGSGVYLTGLASVFAALAGLQLIGQARKSS